MFHSVTRSLMAGAVAITLSSVAWAEDKTQSGETVVEKIRLPRDMQAGFVHAGYVSLDQPAGREGVTVFFALSGEGDVEMPTAIHIKEGQTWGRFPIYVDDQLTRRQSLDVAAATTGGDGAASSAIIVPAPAQSRTVFQRRVTVRYSKPD